MKLQIRALFPVATLFLISGAESSIAVAGDDNWDSNFGIPGIAGYGVVAASVYGSSLYVGGAITSAGSVGVTNIAQWDGNIWSGVKGGIGTGLQDGVSAFAASGGFLYVGGDFSQAGGTTAVNIASWNGTNWTGLGSGANGSVEALAVVGANLYAGGQFSSVGGISALRIARWDGSSWSALGAITNVKAGCVGACFDDGAVFALGAVGNDLYVGGRFVWAGGAFATNIAKWDGTNWSALGTGLDGYPRAMAAANNGIYVAGDFRYAGGVRVNHIARWDGVAWHSVGGGVDDDLAIQALAVNGNDVYAGGSFGSIGGVSARRIAKWDGAMWAALGSGMGDFGGGAGVGALACNGSELFVGGYFLLAGNKPSTNIAVWHIPYAISISRYENRLRLAWPAAGTNFLLEAIDTIGQTNWSAVPQPFSIVNDQCVVTNDISPSNRFYRLRRK